MLKIMLIVAMAIMVIRFATSAHKGSVTKLMGDTVILITLYAAAF